jgi:hypothetical protein
MATTNERVSILETKVDGIREDLGELRKENRQDHDRVMQKLDRLEGIKNYWLGGIAIIGPMIAYAAAHIDWAQVFR